MNVKEALLFAKKELNDVPDRDVDAAWIVCAVTGIKRNLLRFEENTELTENAERILKATVARRKTREPLQYIFGTVPFYNITLKTDERALIPRDETALVVERAMELIQKHGCKTVLDIGTGTGAIALTVKSNLNVAVTATDISERALSLAKENAERLKLDVEFIKSDLFEKLEGRKFDCIISNPPYVATKDMDSLERELSFEPQNALDGGADGLDFYRDIVGEAKLHLNENGLLIFEIGFDQGDALRAIFAKNGFIDSHVEKDYSGLDRIAWSVIN